jgi:hypothetical protein
VREPQDLRGTQSRSRRVYVTRRLLAALVVLLLLALIVPRACQTLFGTGEDQEPGAPEEKGVGIGDAKKHAHDEEPDAEHPSGNGDVTSMESGAASEGATPNEDKGSDAERPSPDDDKTRTKSGTGEEDAADEGAEEQVAAATVSLADLVTGPVIADGDILVASAEDTSAEQTTLPAVVTDVEEGWQADAQQAAEVHPTRVTERAPTERQSPASQNPSADRPGTDSPNATVAPAQKRRPKPPPERASWPVAEPDDEPGAAAAASAAEPVLEPEPAPATEAVNVAVREPVNVDPILAEPVAAAPVSPAPPPVVCDKGFAAGVGTMPANTSRMATGVGGGTARNNAVAFPGAGAVPRASAVAGRVDVYATGNTVAVPSGPRRTLKNNPVVVSSVRL